ncbi:hypothetical protein DL764_003870 [Monosporascus ibericus]|uniref:DUF7025 domain-containing protein n=1 Tax=Monosporascus ibericus TaxID=155417 RepID=A0A4Q4TIF0_9PEZI|nr:hypothetical protein DL764_003870 [Monosporascus ibericus]
MRSPDSALIRSWSKAHDEAKKYGNDSDPKKKSAGEDLKEILRWISTSSGNEVLDRYFKSREKLQDSGMIAFDCLWALFAKGTLIVAKPFLKEHQIFFVQSVTMPDLEDDEPMFSIVAYSYEWDGSRFGRVPYPMQLPFFTDKKKISELDFYPLDYHVDAQGQQTFKYEGFAYHNRESGLFRSHTQIDDESGSYRSDMSYYKQSPDTADPPSTSYIKGVGVVDFKSYFQYQSPFAATLGGLCREANVMECSCNECKNIFEHLYRYSWDKRRPEESNFEDENYLLFPPRVLGYSLDQKRWVQVQATGLGLPGKANDENFHHKLQLSEEHKDIISKSAIAHGAKNIIDHIPGKGKGLIILLCGAPGVCKSLTAESVASLAEKPLFSVGY